MHLAPGAVKACGCRRPTQSPKHLCCTLKVNWSARGGETAGEVEGGGGEERGELLWVAWRRRLQSRSASDLVIKPHCAAEMGSTLASLRAASWAGVQVEQKICSWSQAW